MKQTCNSALNSHANWCRKQFSSRSMCVYGGGGGLGLGIGASVENNKPQCMFIVYQVCGSERHYVAAPGRT